MDRLVLIGLDGVIIASWLFLVSVGLALTFGVLRILNVAHGSLYALGSYMGAFLVLLYLRTGSAPYLTYLLLLAGALFIGLTAGPFLERAILRWIYAREEVVQILVTFAVLLILEDVIKLAWGTSPITADQPYRYMGQFQVVGVSYATYPFLVTLLAVLSGLALWFLLNRTRTGRVILSVIEDREVSQAMGVNVGRVYLVAFTLGAFLAALGGAFTAPTHSVVPGMGVEVIVLAFAVVAIGGLGSISGAALGSLLVGLARAGAIHLIPELDLVMMYLVMALVLLIRPEGLFGQAQIRRI